MFDPNTHLSLRSGSFDSSVRCEASYSQLKPPRPTSSGRVQMLFLEMEVNSMVTVFESELP